MASEVRKKRGHTSAPVRPEKNRVHPRRADPPYLHLQDETSHAGANGGANQRQSDFELTESRTHDRHMAALAFLGRSALAFSDSLRFRQIAVRLLAMVLGTECAELLEMAPDEKTLELRAGIGWEPESVGKVTMDVDIESHARSVLISERPVIFTANEKEHAFSIPPAFRRHGAVIGMACRIQCGGQPAGLLGVHTRKLKSFSERDKEFLACAAELVGSALHQVEVRERHSARVDDHLDKFRQIEESLRARIQDRTAELEAANQRFQRETQERWRAERALALLVEVTAVANGSTNLVSMISGCLRQTCLMRGWPVGQAWLFDAQKNALVWMSEAYYSKAMATEFTEACQAMSLARGVCLPGAVWESRQPDWVEDLSQKVDSPRAALAAAAGLRASAAFPILFGDKVFAVLEFLSTEVQRSDPHFLEAARKLGIHLGIVFERLRGQEELGRQREFTDNLVASSREAIFAFDRQGRITVWNPAVERMFGRSKAEALGQSVLEVVPFYKDSGAEFIRGTLQGQSMVGKERSYRTPENGVEGFFEGYWSPLWESAEARRVIGGLVILHDVTDRKRAEDKLRELSGRLLTLQDQERRRIARELHDSTAQVLVGASLTLMRAHQNGASESERKAAIEETEALIGRALNEVRSLSYLLHPPELEAMGLPTALEHFVRGFSQRTGIKISLDIAPGLEKLPSEAAITIFRTIQESLTNVHRHSGSAVADIKICLHAGLLNLELKDRGRGMPADIAEGTSAAASKLGVGIPGMRERLRQLGGKLEIISTPHGSSVKVELQIPRASKQLA